MPAWPHPRPPLRHARHRTFGRILLDADADPATGVRHVLDAIGHGLARALVQHVMPTDLLGSALGVIRAPAIGTVADPCFCLRIDRDDRLPAVLNVFDPGLEVLKRRVPL